MTKPRLSTIFLIGGLILTTLAAVNFFIGRNDEMKKRIWTEGQLEKVTSAKEALEQEKEELTKAKETLESQLNDATSKAKQIEEQFAAEKRNREAMAADLSRAQSEAGDLLTRLESERREKLDLTEELSKAKQSYRSLSNELTTLRQAKEALEKRVKEMLSAQTNEADRIVVTPTPSAEVPVRPSQQPQKPAAVSTVPGKSLEGKVLVVNREFNFVVVNLGSKSGIKEGTRVSVLRGDKSLGTAQVEKLYENMAAATIMTEEKKGQIKEGDTVKVIS